MNLSLNLSRCVVVTAIVGVNSLLVAQAPGKPVSTVPVTPFSDVQRGYAALKGNILKSADRMPAENYSYRPTPEVRTYARVVNHITEAQWHSCGAINGTAAEAQPKVSEETADKATIVAALNASFAECDKAFASLTEANLLQMIPSGPSTRSRIGLAWGTVSHDNEQYATLALYLRLKGLVPPSSEK
ncbi:putative damage-inducible protein DinB [Granulicella aggregans]|uniref:Putative damage-inducible protein DinB n=1 Tax=Granulicella aggregans TaxID=474949 RepID=A0A7W8E650_9BACT|nr:DinB family protein [Granulicella aggregans]MBB5058880.1 putative damage-inducible protein DinB [Granulicella aggregans]